MDGLIWDGSLVATSGSSLWSGSVNGDCEGSFFISSPTSSRSFEELQTAVTEILVWPTIDIAGPNMSTDQQPQEALHLVMDPILGQPEAASDGNGAADSMLLSHRESSWHFGASSDGLLLGEPDNDKGSAPKGCFWHTFENPRPKQQNPTSDKRKSSTNVDFQQPASSCLPCANNDEEAADPEAVAQIKEMMYHAAVFRPANLGLGRVEKKRRRNVKISKDPQTVAARKRRERVSEKIRALQRLVPGGCKMDTASTLDEAANYLKFLKAQIGALESLSHELDLGSCLPTSMFFSFYPSFPMNTYFPL